MLVIIQSTIGAITLLYKVSNSSPIVKQASTNSSTKGFKPSSQTKLNTSKTLSQTGLNTLS
jgi:hypothetical protein